MTKQTKTNNKTTATASTLDWNKEAELIAAASKQKPGSRGDMLGKLGVFLAGGTPGALVLREAAGERGAQVFIDAPRNVLAKLQKLGTCIAASTPWCSASSVVESGSRKEDASVVVALASLGAGDERQKAVVAAASARYPGGANAQMPAALDALTIVGIVERKQGGPRNAEYAIKDEARAQLLMPRN